MVNRLMIGCTIDRVHYGGRGMTIRDAGAADEIGWRRLWDGYNAFYQTSVPAAVTDRTWARILDPAVPLFARLAVAEDGSVTGFAGCVLHWGTWLAEPICYLEDLYVDPAARGQGIAGALIQDLIDRGRSGAWGRLYWHTRADNATARRLYDRFTVADAFVRYQLAFDSPAGA
jgi:GNAT superfamily N-acetyltransferase